MGVGKGGREETAEADSPSAVLLFQSVLRGVPNVIILPITKVVQAKLYTHPYGKQPCYDSARTA